MIEVSAASGLIGIFPTELLKIKLALKSTRVKSAPTARAEDFQLPLTD
jgi:hypothetical protein